MTTTTMMIVKVVIATMMLNDGNDSDDDDDYYADGADDDVVSFTMVTVFAPLGSLQYAPFLSNPSSWNLPISRRSASDIRKLSFEQCVPSFRCWFE